MDRTVTSTRSAQAAPRLPTPWLRLLWAPGGRAQTWPLAPGVVRVGRDAALCDVDVPEDSRLSRHHLTLRVGPGLRITETLGRNGTFVNRERVGEGGSPLQDGDLLRAGDSLFLVRYEAAESQDAQLPGVIGGSPAMKLLRASLARVARDRASVLFRGETGTGKEVLTAALHQASERAGALVAVNCGAIPGELAESQLFGHTAGAFTGARPHPGYFRAAHRGTLFLDELGEMPLPVQPRLLRALEERAVVPVGSTTPLLCDIRVVAATHRDLEGDIGRGTFRRDLYARLSDVVLFVPPLRERREDVLPLLAHAGADPSALPPEMVEQLVLHPWPLNVREVYKIANHLRLFGPDAGLLERLRTSATLVEGSADSTPPGRAPSPDREVPRGREGPPDREELEALMARHGGVVQDVADELGWSRRQVGRWLDALGVDRDRYRADRGRAGGA